MYENTDFKKAKSLSLVSIIVGLLCVVLVVASIFSVIAGSMFNIPILKMAVGEAEITNTETMLNDLANDIIQADTDKKAEFETITGISADKAAKELRSPSLNTLIKYSMVEELEVTADVVSLFKTVRLVIIVYAAVIAFFALLGALLKCRPLTIVAMVISLPYFIFLAGALFLIVFFALSIAHVVLVTKAKKAARPVPQPMYPPVQPPVYPNNMQ